MGVIVRVRVVSAEIEPSACRFIMFLFVRASLDAYDIYYYLVYVRMFFV